MRKTVWWILVLAWAYLIFYLTTIPNFKPSDDTLLSFLLSNGGHFIFFGIQALLLKFAISMPPAFILTSLYGLAIEFVQLHIPGRSFDLKDWALDMLGAITFLFLLKKLQSKQ